jgi:alpha-1,3-rhamnosyl/mannosyltransferase
VAGAAPARTQVLIDARPLQGPSALRGIGTYVRGLLGGLAEEGFAGRLALLLDRDLPDPELPVRGLPAYVVRRRYHGRFATYEDAVALGGDLRRIQPRLYHATNLSLPGRSPVPMVVTLHDLIPWAWPGVHLRGERVRYRLGRRALAGANRVIAVSEATARDAVAHAGVQRSRITVIPEAAGATFQVQKNAEERVSARWGLPPGRYFVYVGALDARKDPRGLLQAWRRASDLSGGLELALAGEPGRQAPPPPPGVRRLGHVPDAELADLLSVAGCLVFASRYEGFGLPVLEAMSCGCPVAAYANSSIPEVAGAAAQLVPDGDARSLGEAAARLVSDGALRRKSIAAGLRQAARYSWRKTARATIATYRGLLT